jgi:hypothetical protein
VALRVALLRLGHRVAERLAVAGAGDHHGELGREFTPAAGWRSSSGALGRRRDGRRKGGMRVGVNSQNVWPSRAVSLHLRGAWGRPYVTF